jgi:hypothetical protein
MISEKQKVLGLLRLEIEDLSRGGFGGFLCISRRSGSCGECTLLDFVPVECRKEDMPCLHIPLNERGETLHTIAQQRDRAYLEKQLVAWMKRTAKQLQEELAPGYFEKVK